MWDKICAMLIPAFNKHCFVVTASKTMAHIASCVSESAGCPNRNPRDAIALASGQHPGQTDESRNIKAKFTFRYLMSGKALLLDLNMLAAFS